MTICEQAAAQTRWDRHVDQAFAIVANAKANLVVGVREPLRAITGGYPARAPRGSGHPSLRKLRADA